MKIEGKSVVVTGGASGLGSAVVEYFLEEGAMVTSLDLVHPNQKGVLFNGRLLQIKTDVTSEESLTKALESTLTHFGCIAILVNAAGMAVDYQRTFGKDGAYPLDVFRKVLDVNLVGSFNAARLAAGYMSMNEPEDRGERGVIINTASISAQDGPVGSIAYTVAKSGVQGMTLTMARDLAKYGIRVCTIAPGSFDTPMLRKALSGQIESLVKDVPFPNDRLGDPYDFARLVEAICCNPMINGEIIRLDGAARLSHM